MRDPLSPFAGWLILGLLHGLVLVYLVWLLGKFYKTGRAPVWNGLTKTSYVARHANPVTYWVVMTLFGVVILAVLSFIANDLVGGRLFG